MGSNIGNRGKKMAAVGSMRILGAMFGAGLLVACAGTSAPDVTAYKIDPGPYDVAVADGLILKDPEQDRDVKFRVAYPKGEGAFPVIVYSNGAFCFTNMYANVTDHWVSHGYVVVQPYHLDTPDSGGRPDLSQRDALVLSRLRDMSFALDALDDIEAQLPDFVGETDRDNMAVGGHSFGGWITLTKSGVPLDLTKDGMPEDYSDDRFDVAVVMSGVGQMEQMADDAFSYMNRPTFASGGTLDLGNVGDGNIYPWEWRMAAFYEAPTGGQYYGLVLDEGDHYLGGLICREDGGGEADPQGVSIVNGASTAFLDAYLKGDRKALNFLKTADFDSLTNGRATFETK